jgi:hypothetical protein
MPLVKGIDADENVSSAVMKTEIMCIDGDGNRNTEETVDLNMDELKDIPFDTGKDVFNCWNG